MPEGPNERDETVDKSDEHRKFSRGEVYITIDVREHGGGRHKALILDLSEAGCRISSLTYMGEGKNIHITLPGFAPLEAVIVWKKRDEYGCSFLQRLHPAIYDHIRTKYPSLGHL